MEASAAEVSREISVRACLALEEDNIVIVRTMFRLTFHT